MLPRIEKRSTFAISIAHNGGKIIAERGTLRPSTLITEFLCSARDERREEPLRRAYCREDSRIISSDPDDRGSLKKTQ